MSELRQNGAAAVTLAAMRLFSLMFLLASTANLLCAQTAAPGKVLDVYPGAVPGALGHAAEDRPTIDVYLPSANPTHTAVLVIPGGGYRGVTASYEGAGPAQWLTQRGVAAFVLHYRVAPYRYPAPIADAERAMRLVRGRAAEFGFSPDHLGAWGFSAGGHITSILATLFDNGIPASSDPIEHASDRPDFVVLAYPVISMKPGVGHAGSRENLLGPLPDPALVALLSSEDHVTPMSPPAFVFTTNDDDVVDSRNSMLYVAACQRAAVPVEFHMFEHGHHGVGLAEQLPGLRMWPSLLESWMQQNQWMAAATP
jgi:acetyl esterase/lipase